MLDFEGHIFEAHGQMVMADTADRKRWGKIGVRRLIRKTGLSQKTVYAIITGQPVRPSTLVTFRRRVEELSP